MNIQSIVARFYLPGCRSLKEKRGRLRGLRERYGRASNVAVSEILDQDAHQQAQYLFVACGASAAVVEKTLAEIERELQFAVDGQLLSMERRQLG